MQRALLIASQTAGLRGCHSDVALMADVLGDRGFSCDVLTDGTATQARILDRYQSLIDETREGDASVVYYSGHGGRIRNLASINDTTNAYWQFIVPTDFEESTEDDFRGILAEELRALQLALSTKTDNVTTILDCCHSALMSRDPTLVARFLQRSWTELRPGAIARWKEADEGLRAALASSGIDHEDFESNQRAVRLVACLPSESAFEMLAVEFDAVHGLFTAALAGLLRQVQSSAGVGEVTWDDVVAQLRSSVLSRAAQQHVLVEGPSRRLVFSSEQHDAARGWPVELSENVIRVPGAAFLGIGPGDTVSLVPGGRQADDTERIDATVTRLEGGRAVLALANRERLGPGTVAYPAMVSSQRRKVVVGPSTGPAPDKVIHAIRRSSRLEPVDAATTPLASVVVTDAGMMLVNQDGMSQYAEPRPVTSTELDRLTNDLEHLARVAVLRELVSGTGNEALDIPVGFSVHATPDGPPIGSSTTLPEGSVYMRVHHYGELTDPSVFVNVIDLGQAGDVNMLSAEASPTGIELTPKQTYQLYGQEGTWLSWPTGVPKDEPRPETFVAVFTDGEQDMRAVAMSGIAARDATGRTPAVPGTLQSVIDLAATGASRSASRRPSSGPEPLRYHVERFELLLDPGFQVDESIELSGRGRSRATPVNLAVRLLDLVVRRNRAMFSTDVRLDALFITGCEIDDGHPYVARTWRFPRIADGDRLSADELGLYVGPAQDFLEMAVWVSRANQANPNLAELIGSSLRDGTMGGAADDLLGLVGVDPTGLAVRAGLSAIGAFLEASGRVLREAVNRSIGLYRTTLLVPEGLTEGRRPSEGLRETQDMAFAYDVAVRI